MAKKRKPNKVNVVKEDGITLNYIYPDNSSYELKIQYKQTTDTDNSGSDYIVIQKDNDETFYLDKEVLPFIVEYINKVLA